MAKILFVGQASSQMEFSYQAFFALHAASELMGSAENNRGAGACFMILGIMLAMQSQQAYHRSIKYIKKSEELQLEIIAAREKSIRVNGE